MRPCAQGEYLQFYLCGGDVVQPLCAATPHNLRTQLPGRQSVAAVCAYTQDAQYECLAVLLNQ